MGGSSKKVTVGYDYYMSVDFAVSGEIDILHEIIYGERSAWKGQLSATSDIYINNPNLFGGRNREGGVRGTVSALFGRQDQGRHPFLQSQIGAEVPAYRGVFRLLFQNFMWSSMNPYFKALWVRATAITAGWNHPDGCWYPEKSVIGRRDGQPVTFNVTVAWAGENFKTPQTIAYKLQYKEAADAGFTDYAIGAFSGGAAPTAGAAAGNGKTGGTADYGFQSVTGGGFGIGDFASYSSGSTPSASRVHAVTLPYGSYTFQVVKTDGSRYVPAVFSAPATTLYGVAYGGSVSASAVTPTGEPNYPDMNPAHILYKLLTAPQWQLYLPRARLNDAKWRAAADTLYAEKFGLSFQFSSASETKQHIQRVLDHINGYFKHDLATDTISLELIRDGYDLETLTVLDNDNSILVEYQSSLHGGDVPNEIIVKWRDSNEEPKASAPATNQSGVNAQGGVIRSETEYEGVHRQDLADALARRDVKMLGSNLKKVTRKTNRVLWNHVRGDVVLITDPTIGVTEAPYRIVDIDKGSLSSGEITVQLVEDVFGLDVTQYSGAGTSTVFDPTEALPVAAMSILELPYYMVHVSTTEAERAALSPGYGFAVAITQRNTIGAFSATYDLYSSLDDSLYVVTDADASYTPVGSLSLPIGKADTSFTVTPLVDFSVMNVDETAEVVLVVGQELMALDTLDGSTGAMAVRRGVADSVPQAHLANSKVYILTPSMAKDATTRLVGDLVYYKAQPISSGAILPLENAVAVPYTYSRRAERPYPPGALKINGLPWPAGVVFGDVVISWAHRDRLTQTAGLSDYTTASIGPEAGTTYTVEIFSGATLLRSVPNISGTTYTYAQADIVADGAPSALTVSVKSVRSGLDSRYAATHTFTITGLGLGLGLSLGV